MAIQGRASVRTARMRTRKRKLIALLFLGSALIGACTDNAGTSKSGSSGDDATDIAVVNIAYDPASIEIDAGTSIRWLNEDEGVRHTVTSGLPGDNGVPGVSEGEPPKPDGVFDGDLPDASSGFTFTFDEPGTYAYFCRVHPSMTGEVIVI